MLVIRLDEWVLVDLTHRAVSSLGEWGTWTICLVGPAPVEGLVTAKVIIDFSQFPFPGEMYSKKG